MCFLPGKLSLESKPGGVYELRLGEEATTFRSQRAAFRAFQQLRTQLEKDFPAREPSLEERRALLQQDIADSVVRHNSLRDAAPRKKTGTRTFG